MPITSLPGLQYCCHSYNHHEWTSPINTPCNNHIHFCSMSKTWYFQLRCGIMSASADVWHLYRSQSLDAVWNEITTNNSMSNHLHSKKHHFKGKGSYIICSLQLPLPTLTTHIMVYVPDILSLYKLITGSHYVPIENIPVIWSVDI